MKLREVAVLQQERNGLTAAAGPPLVPPREWFEMEEPDEPTGLKVTADGQVYGHAALWGTCHTGKPGKCVTPPRSKSGYSYYKTGLTEVDDGELIPTGRITLGTGHASLTASPAAAAEHYDNTGSVVADVNVCDGKHGIWVSGALRPDVPPERIRTLRGASLSGDWRNIRGALEMLGLLAVNVPGFPVPQAMAASGAEDEVLALVAAGTLTQELYQEVLAASTVVEPTDEEWEAAISDLTAAAERAERNPRQRKIAKVMREFKAGKLKSSSGQKVTSRKQALAIAMSESRRASGEIEPVVADSYEGEKRDLIEAGWTIRDEGDGWCLLEAPDGEVRLVRDTPTDEPELTEEPDEDEVLIADEELYAKRVPMTAAEEARRKEGLAKRGLKADASLEEELVVSATEGGTQAEPCEECAEPEFDPLALPAAGGAVERMPGDRILAASFTQAQREQLAKGGLALPDGSFPIRNRRDLRDQLRGFERAADPEAARQHFILRASALNAVHLLPASWNVTREELAAAGTFDESKHPRHPKGDERGGQFAAKTSPRHGGPSARAGEQAGRSLETALSPDEAARRMGRTGQDIPLEKVEPASEERIQEVADQIDIGQSAPTVAGKFNLTIEDASEALARARKRLEREGKILDQRDRFDI